MRITSGTYFESYGTCGWLKTMTLFAACRMLDGQGRGVASEPTNQVCCPYLLYLNSLVNFVMLVWDGC